MKTIRNRYTSRGHGHRHEGGRDGDWHNDAFSDDGLEDSWRNEDYYFDRVQQRRGYSNRDHAGGNYWPSNDDVRDQREGGSGDYVPSFDYGPGRRERHSRTYGYGGANSPSMDDYRHWSESNEPEGYAGRNRHDYEGDYGGRDRYYYDPGDYDRGGFRRNREAEFHNRYAVEHPAPYGERRGDHYSYGEYESYPNYDSDRRWRNERGGWPGRSNRFRNEPAREYQRHRPYIREKRY